MAEVDILLAAYNGERFVAEQIDSLLAQTFQDFRVLIRDDGSSDNTPAIIETYAKKYPDKIEVVHDDVVCRNPTKNFFELMKHARADYVMFCDQDDVWLPYKIQITMDYMKRTERDNPGKPVLVFTGLQVVDAELKSMDYLMSLNISEKRYTFRELLPCNCVAGCTQMINRALYESVGEFQDAIVIHDWWIALYASAMGVVVRVPMALILYRQHGNNVMGASVPVNSLRRILHRLYGFICYPAKRFAMRKEYFYSTKKMVDLFRQRYFDRLSKDRIQETDTFVKLFVRNRLTRFNTYRKEHYIRYADELSIYEKISMIINLVLL